MLQSILFISIFVTQVYSDGSGTPVKPYMFPIPFQLPNRNDRADQCWIRIEDVDLTETLTVLCRIANAFLKAYIHEYNSKKMIEDEINVSLWNEEARSPDDVVPKVLESDPSTITDWKTTTVMDPITKRRLYVSKKADCRLVMYSREGMSNYRVDCAPFLYFVNERLSGGAAYLCAKCNLTIACVFMVLLRTIFF